MEQDKIIINIGRRIGSGGKVIARLLAERFSCKFYDQELLNLAAKESGFCEEFFRQNDERKGFFRNLFHIHTPFVSDNSFYQNDFSQESLFKIQSDVIRKAADEGPCVFVGRCADYVLRDNPNCFSVFITAGMESRVAAVASRRMCDEREAQKLIEHGERQRAEYYNYYTGKRWGDSASYDLCISTDILGVEATAKVIEDVIRQRIARDRK